VDIEYVLWYMHIHEYMGLSTTTTKERYIVYVGECRCNYRRVYYMRVYIFLSRIYYYRVYICTGANVLLLYTLHLSMYLYTEYSVCLYMDICGYGLLINGCMYELIFK
jgi:hypothetical protein